jgi:hypothetical protein
MITLDVYTQAVGSNKRAAQSKVVRMMISGVGQNAVEMDSQKSSNWNLMDLYWSRICLSL